MAHRPYITLTWESPTHILEHVKLLKCFTSCYLEVRMLELEVITYVRRSLQLQQPPCARQVLLKIGVHATSTWRRLRMKSLEMLLGGATYIAISDTERLQYGTNSQCDVF
jgi:hypothetical protein